MTSTTQNPKPPRFSLQLLRRGLGILWLFLFFAIFAVAWTQSQHPSHPMTRLPLTDSSVAEKGSHIEIAKKAVGAKHLSPQTAIRSLDDSQKADFRSFSIRGIALGLFASDPNYDYHTLLREIADHGATDVLLAITWYQEHIGSAVLAPWPGRSPSLENYRRTIRQARRLGLRVAIMPMVRLKRRHAHEWRGRLRPAGGPIAWFASYTRYLVTLARIAQQEGATRFAIGSELASLESYTPAWNALIQHIRKHFRGRLFYSANWDHLHRIEFAKQLDEIAVTAYIPMLNHPQKISIPNAPNTDTKASFTEPTTATPWNLVRRKLGAWGRSLFGQPSWPTDATMTQQWRAFFRTLQTYQQRWKRPIYLSEVGYPALSSAAKFPWDETRKASTSTGLQTHLWKGFCNAYHTQPHSLRGFYAWNWFGFGGPSDRSYTPRGKPAARILMRCLQSH